MASLPKELPEDAKKQSFWVVRITPRVRPHGVARHMYEACDSFCRFAALTSRLLQPGNYVCTVRRTERSFQACSDIVACFAERARVERQYAQQLSQWGSKWKSIVESRKCEKLQAAAPLVLSVDAGSG
ncbi:Protein kinase C and casein kinase substrate in neurons protein 3 [Liparis tanakae]|uniref:Protein kinase C and casein kinase substrate in neurons protein 3 n=1 Tax=Liparis tanakae TaxID=230148 RepID=A0A4Z2DZL0_9TELE|nr:Protein kinase C and casein kinase substrate in neurons protein 3 [Liparis tanakae]